MRRQPQEAAKIWVLPISWPLLYIAIALTTLGTLLLELSLTRIFSVVFYYHFAFLAISIALFGLGVGGIFSYIAASWRGNLFKKLGILSAANCGLVVLAVTVLLANHAGTDALRLALVYITCALPFFCSGVIVSLVISETIQRINRVYFFDLLGAAGGCLLLVPLLETFGGPNTTLSVAVLFAVAAAIWFNLAHDRFGRVASVGLALLLTLLVVLNYRAGWIDVRWAKGQQLAHEQFSQWNSFSRIGLRPETPGGIEAIFIDADAETGIANYNFDHLTPAERADLLHQGESLPYNVRPGAKSLIIGPGGGWDVARALASGSKDITGVEINPIIATTIMRKKFPQLSQGLYFRPEVHIYEHEGRSFVRGSAEKYQVLQATLVDTWASTAAGAFALSENNLYTTDAFKDYLTHLTDDGMLTITRWGFDPPRESLRLVALGIAALKDIGESDAADHFIIARADSSKIHGWGARDTVLIARKAFSVADRERARQAMTDANLRPVYLPGANIPNQFTQLLQSPNPTRFERAYRYDITPVSDNRPFFFYTVQPRDLIAFLTAASKESEDYTVNTAVPLLFELLTISIIAVAVMLFLPPVLLGARLPREKSVQIFLLYFLLIGAGYILVEVALIQKFVLFLGHPTYALWVVIFSMLLSSGLGSYFSRKVVGGVERRLALVLGGVAVVIVMLAASVGVVLTSLVGLPTPAKILISVLMISPAGFLMGMPFPIALARLEAWHKPALRWAWSLNAASSVLGSVGALVCAIYLGLMQTLVVGGMLYVAALLVFTLNPPNPIPVRITLVQEEKVRT